MENDDKPVGTVLSRREFLTLMTTVAGAGLLAACTGLEEGVHPGTMEPQAAAPTGETPVDPGSLPSCVVRPEMTEGPFFVDTELNRSDIRPMADGSLKEGVALKLAFNVSEIGVNTCTPLQDAVVDVWHCDALGVYSGVNDPFAGYDASEMQFLRGYQVTDENGNAEFITIYPGWYSGRAVHIHFKIRSEAPSGAIYDFTSQLFFDEGVTDQVHMKDPYASKGQRNTRNESDGIYRRGGDQLTLTPAQHGDGYTAVFNIGLDL